MRTVFYIRLRVESIEDIKDIDSWDPISPDHMFLMGIEEFVLNVILLYYFFAMSKKVNES